MCFPVRKIQIILYINSKLGKILLYFRFFLNRKKNNSVYIPFSCFSVSVYEICNNRIYIFVRILLKNMRNILAVLFLSFFVQSVAAQTGEQVFTF